MTARWMRQRWQDALTASPLYRKGHTYRVGITLSQYMDLKDLTRAYPGIPTLMERTGASESTVKRALATLEADGWIRKVAQGGQGPRTNVWEGVIPPGAEVEYSTTQPQPAEVQAAGAKPVEAEAVEAKTTGAKDILAKIKASEKFTDIAAVSHDQDGLQIGGIIMLVKPDRDDRGDVIGVSFQLEDSTGWIDVYLGTSLAADYGHLVADSQLVAIHGWTEPGEPGDNLRWFVAQSVTVIDY